MSRIRHCLFLFACAGCWWLGPGSTADAADLTIGSKAPALDIEHWIQDGGGKFKPVEEFEKDRVYVVEFWATWCGPCIASMPHLAELQSAYDPDELRIISVSDEETDEIKQLLGREHPELNKTFDEITNAYSLTADPDGSTHQDYMAAAKVQGIPTSFLVGKTGLVEWIGHPMELDDVVEKVLNDDWDREAYKEEREKQVRRMEVIQEMATLARQGRYEEALQVVQEELDRSSAADDESEADYWQSVVASLKMSAGKLDDQAISFYREKLKEMDGDFIALSRFAYSLYGVHEDGGDVGPLAGEAIEALQATLEAKKVDELDMYYHLIALLHDIQGNAQEAYDAQKQAVEEAEGVRKERFQQSLELFEADLKEAQNAAKKGEEEKGED